MGKYWTVFLVSWQNEFVYRLNFVLWRFRNILRLLMTYFLWRGIFISNQNIFGYSQPQMLTYVFMVLVVQTLVTSAPSADNIGGEISNGDLSNFLVKPMGYLKYWFTRDVASKLLNLIFAVFEVSVLWFFLRPQIMIPLDFFTWAAFILSVSIAMVLYYFVSVCARFVAFWIPEYTWGLSFVVLVFMEILAGGIFPLNILPQILYEFIQLTPFPYMVYFPIAIFSGKIVGLELARILLQYFIWLGILFLFTKYLWSKGLKVYQASGR